MCVDNRSLPPFAQALRLGTFLAETKPLKFLHASDAEAGAPAPSGAPLVLRLGTYLNGGDDSTSSGDTPTVLGTGDRPCLFMLPLRYSSSSLWPQIELIVSTTASVEAGNLFERRRRLHFQRRNIPCHWHRRSPTKIVWIHTHTHICVCVCMYIYIYRYIYM